MRKILLPVDSVVAAALALVAHLLWPQWVTFDLLMGLALALPLPGLPELVRSLRQSTIPATPERIAQAVREGMLSQDQMQELTALAGRWRAATHPALVDAGNQLAAALGEEPAPVKRSTPPRIPPAALLVLLLFLPTLAGCAAWPSYADALKTCGLQVAPAGVQAGVSLALHGGDGWAGALADLVSTYGECVVKAEVTRAANGDVQAPPRRADVAPPVATLLGGELTANAGGVSAEQKKQAQLRAQQWLKGRR